MLYIQSNVNPMLHTVNISQCHVGRMHRIAIRAGGAKAYRIAIEASGETMSQLRSRSCANSADLQRSSSTSSTSSRSCPFSSCEA